MGIHKLEDLPIRNGRMGSSRVLIGPNLMVIWANISSGNHTPAHSHVNEQMTWLITGQMTYRVGDQEPQVILPGSVVHIPPNMEHEVWYTHDCHFCEIFTPPRYDLYQNAAQ